MPADAHTIEAHPTDATRAAAGDVHAFERLYRAHVARVHGLARRMLGADEADEATQDVFVRAWTRLDTFRGEAAFATWLHRLAVNVFLGRRREAGRDRQRHTTGEGALESVATRPTRSDLSLDFEAAIASLPPGAREVFVLHDVEGYKHQEIARTLGIAGGTSKSQLHRARMALRRHLT